MYLPSHPSPKTHLSSKMYPSSCIDLRYHIEMYEKEEDFWLAWHCGSFQWIRLSLCTPSRKGNLISGPEMLDSWSWLGELSSNCNSSLHRFAFANQVFWSIWKLCQNQQVFAPNQIQKCDLLHVNLVCWPVVYSVYLLIGMTMSLLLACWLGDKLLGHTFWHLANAPKNWTRIILFLMLHTTI